MKFLFIALLVLTSLYGGSKNISLQLLWKHQFQFAGFYVAKEMGFYDEVDLNVTIKEYDTDIDVVQEVVNHRATFGVGRSSIVIDNSKNRALVVLGAIFQSSPSVLATTDPHIVSLSDLKGKRVMITADSVSSASIFAMLKSNDIDINDIKIQKHSFDIRDLVNNKTDAVSIYVSNEPYYLKKHNINYKIFDPKVYGYDFYGDMLFTSKDEIANNPEEVKAFYKATLKGWLWAFDHIDKSVAIIQEKYNTQNRSKEALIYEAQELKKLAFKQGTPFGFVSKMKFNEIVNNYKLAGFIQGYKLDNFVDPLNLNKKIIKIGILAKRGTIATYKRWSSLAKYLNDSLESYNFKIVPLDFQELEVAIAHEDIDFLITNPGYYVYLEDKYKVVRIATLINDNSLKHNHLKEYGGVIITQKNNKAIKRLEDIRWKSFAAVDEKSFGGWIMAKDLFDDEGIDVETMKVQYLGTHDSVVKEVLSGRIAAGIVRTDTLENMATEGLINMDEIKVIHPHKYKDFPYLISTKLYPEWPFSKLKHTSDELALQVFAKLIDMSKEQDNMLKLPKWGVPADYTLIHETLKKLHIAPYDGVKITFKEVYKKYSVYIFGFILLMIAVIGRSLHLKYLNSYLKDYNENLNNAVSDRTKELEAANKKLKVLAQTDFLTGITNRRFFMKLGNKYFDIAKRNTTPLQCISLDLDFFKNINDTYGHQVGDIVLIEFTKVVTSMLRKSDVFGRIGGEEFAIIMQNTSQSGALQFAQKICDNIAAMEIENNMNIVKISVSIGIATLSDEQSVEELLKKSDKALYQAKDNGRNRVVMF